jgi:hypothetical protein
LQAIEAMHDSLILFNTNSVYSPNASHGSVETLKAMDLQAMDSQTHSNSIESLMIAGR